MSVSAPTTNGHVSLLPPEKTPTSTPKQRSCVVCRTRKVRCDKQSPCSNCRRAKIACVFPSKDRPPKWARRLERVAQNAASKEQASQEPDAATVQVMDRLRNLESLVKELSGQLEQANAAVSSAGGGSSGVNSPGSYSHERDIDHQRDASPNTDTSNVRKQFGRLVLQDANRSRYISSGFWSRVNDELDGLKMDSRGLGGSDSDTSEDGASQGKSPPTQELERTPSERHSFLFRHNLSPLTHDLRDFHPLPSQVPFLLDVFSENVNTSTRMVHMPTVTKMIRDLRGSDMTSLTPANEALMFSIYYAAVTSMDEDDIMTNFGHTKTDLNLKYRLGLEHALAKADFLNVPDLVLIQAFAIFLCLVRRHDSPRFTWMMVGLLIRMGQALGLQRDGAHFKHLSPYDVEMRRRVWWLLCVLDVRASEDQGTDYTITRGSFDTRLPLNINDADIEPGSTRTPVEREGLTDMTLPLVQFEFCEVARQMMTQSAKGDAPGIEEQSRLLDGLYQRLDRRYLQYSVESGNIAYWVIVVITRLVVAKMTLFIYLPVLFSSPSEHLSDTIKSKLLVAAIEVAEYNHALNAERACRQWRWIYETYTHWHAIVYLLLEISRRPLSPIVERAWTALHSQWLIPARSRVDTNLRIWIPLRKLMSKARKHRDAEVKRLRGNPRAAEQLVIEDQRIPTPGSLGPYSTGSNAVELFREQWRQLVGLSEGFRLNTHSHGESTSETTSLSAYSGYTGQQTTSSLAEYDAGTLVPNLTFEPAYFGDGGLQTRQNLSDNTLTDLQPSMSTNAAGNSAIGETSTSSYNTIPMLPTNWSMGPGFSPWLWADTDSYTDALPNEGVDAVDVNMDLDGDVDWYNWVESAKGMESDTFL